MVKYTKIKANNKINTKG